MSPGRGASVSIGCPLAISGHTGSGPEPTPRWYLDHTGSLLQLPGAPPLTQHLWTWETRTCYNAQPGRRRSDTSTAAGPLSKTGE